MFFFFRWLPFSNGTNSNNLSDGSIQMFIIESVISTAAVCSNRSQSIPCQFNKWLIRSTKSMVMYADIHWSMWCTISMESWLQALLTILLVSFIAALNWLGFVFWICIQESRWCQQKHAIDMHVDWRSRFDFIYRNYLAHFSSNLFDRKNKINVSDMCFFMNLCIWNLPNKYVSLYFSISDIWFHFECVK